MLLTQDGLRALAQFNISATPQYDGLNREGNDGLTLACKHDHDGGGPWRRAWPGYVEAPTLRGLALVAQEHWREAHQDVAHTEDAKAEVAK